MLGGWPQIEPKANAVGTDKGNGSRQRSKVGATMITMDMLTFGGDRGPDRVQSAWRSTRGQLRIFCIREIHLHRQVRPSLTV